MAQSELDRAFFNIDVLIPDRQQLLLLKEVTSLAIFESNSKVFHPEGLFSSEIFGPVGSQERLTKLGYVNLKVPIIHPLVYDHIISLDSIHADIFAGKKKAIFLDNEKRFVEDKQGRTGYNFFMEYIDQLQYSNPNNSKEREYKIRLVNMYGNTKSLIDHWLIIPAGIRDYGIDSKGRPTQDEINDIYRKLISAVNIIRNVNIKQDKLEQYDIVRYKIQTIILDIFKYIKSLLDGKHKFIQGKWAARAIMDGTRNVITANPTVIKNLEDKNKITLNHTVVGLYQYIKSISPLAMHEIHREFILGSLNPHTNRAKVIDKKTLTTTFKEINIKDKEAWLTKDGLNNMFNKFRQDIIKEDYATIGEDYIALIEDKGKDIYVIKDTNNIPKEVNKSKLRPITYAELVYIAVNNTTERVKLTTTRYPVISVGSIYPSKPYLKTTVIGRPVKVHIDEKVYDVAEFPIEGQKFLGSLSIHNTKLGRLDGDSKSPCLTHDHRSLLYW